MIFDRYDEDVVDDDDVDDMIIDSIKKCEIHIITITTNTRTDLE